MFWFKGIGFRPIEHKDLECVRELRNDPTTWMYLSDITQISMTQQEAWFKSLAESKNSAYFAVFKELQEYPILYEGDFLGLIRFDQIDANNKSVRVGCDIVPKERGKGYGTKVFQAILSYCFDQWGMHRLWLCVLEDNKVAKKLYDNAGFEIEGHMRKAIWRDGKWKDYIVMSLLIEDYRGEKK